MDIQEFGNRVIKGRYKVLVKGLSYDFIEEDNCDLEAIALMPEILLKFGFYQDEYNNYLKR